VVIALGRDAAQGGDIVLKARTHAELVEAMAPWEPNEDKRRLLADKAATQFASFYRAVVPRASIQTPTWAALENVPYLLLGSWDSAYQGDLDAIREISGRDFGPENNRAIDLAKAPEALVHQLGSTISIVRLEDAWDFLGIHATDDQLDAFLRVVKSVFGEVDPQYSIEDPDEAANIGMISNRLGRLKHSMLLRQGLAANLCYLGSMGDTVNGTGKRNGSVVARQAVRALFEEETSWQSFCSLAPWFALFAEASPDDFLTAIERDLKNNPDKIRALFRDGEANKNFFLTHSSPHTFLLWAIETCAWSPHFLTRAALVLARVSKIDPGGSLSNRPKASLRDIFLTWSPKTNASLDYRLAALKMVGSVDGDLYWELLKEILPTGHSIAMGKSGARFRPWGPLWQPPMTHGELRRAVEEVYTLMIDSAGTVGSRWATLLDFIAIMPSGVEQVLLQALGDMATGGLSGEARVQVRECLRQTIARHRSHPDAPWVMPEERLDTLQRLLELYKPADVIEAWRWVFSDHAVFELGPGTDFQAKNLELERLQREAVEVIYRDLGLDGLLLLALGNKSPWKLGVAFAEVGMNLDLATTVQIACEASPDGANFVLGFVGKSTELRGPSVVWDLITSVWGHSLDPHSRMMFLRCLPLNLETLDKLKDLDRETQSRYWNGLGTYSLVRSGEDVVEAVLRNLIEFEAYTNAVAVIAPLVHGPGPKISPGRALQILEDATASNSVDWHRLGHDVAEILDYLDRFPEIDSIRVARLEFTFASFLSLTRNPRRLNRLIAEDPATFILLLRAAYKPRDKTIVEEEDADSLPPPMLAYEVLKSLRTLPGDRGDGSIDSATMRAWIDTGLPLARSANRLEAFESSAGDWFAKSPRGTDGFFPHESVRQVFQHLESEDFERGFEIGVRNERGMVTKQQSEGGDQERRLAESYKRDADALELRWHRAALTMRRISDDYFAEAKQEDRRVRRE
jgi:hypothetical protein